MAISDQEELISSLLEAIDEEGERVMDETLQVIRSLATGYQQQDAACPSPEQVAWAGRVEVAAGRLVDTLSSFLDDVSRVMPAVLFAGENEEPLRWKRAAWAEAWRVEAEEIVSATRSLQEKELRSLAGREDLADAETTEFLAYVSEVTDAHLDDGGGVPSPEEVVDAWLLEHEAVWLMEEMTAFAEKLRRGAVVFAGRPGEEALVQALQNKAAAAEAQRAAAQAVVTATRRYHAFVDVVDPAAAVPAAAAASPAAEETTEPQRKRPRLSPEQNGTD